MKISFFGVRGSLPTPGVSTTKYGGNTNCILVQSDCNDILILDSGTGIKRLGEAVKHLSDEFYILLSHNHWDHIQGFPFFSPAYMHGKTIIITPGLTEQNEPDAILKQMNGSFFPINAEQLSANIKVNQPCQDSWRYKAFNIQRCKLNHPGGGSAYKLFVDEKSIVYATDNELFPPYKESTSLLEWIKFADNADYLIHDGQYLSEDYPFKQGWGHSQLQHAIALAKKARVKNLVIISHDPDRTDVQIDSLQLQLKKQDLPFTITFAFEGLVIE